MNYVTEVAEHFISRRSSEPILSPIEYTVIAEWEKQGIPLDLVIETINEIFDVQVDNADPKARHESIEALHGRLQVKFGQWLQRSGAAA